MRIHRSIGVAILLLCLAACQSRLSQENFDKVHEGMTQKEVRDILGDPVSVEGRSFLGIISAGEAVWKDDKTVITVHFLNEKVASKRMSRADAKGAVAKVEDEKAPPPPPPPKSQ
jgi:outer membrane protein assembly factor BamE (lipoprotein component of BamABCDE complex)